MKEKEQKDYENLTGTVIANYVALHYNEEIKHTRFYKQKIKHHSNLLMKELLKVEENEFNKIYEFDGDSLAQLSENYLEFIKMLTKGSFKDFMLAQNREIAASLDPKRMNNLATKIINEHNEK